MSRFCVSVSTSAVHFGHWGGIRITDAKQEGQ